MKYRLFALALTFSLFIFTPTVRAGFWVKSHITSTNSVRSTPALAPYTAPGLISKLATVSDNRGHGRRDGSGMSIAALVCGILGVAIPAIIFGIIGLGRKGEYKGMALAGVILGGVWLVLETLVVLVFLGVI